MLCPIMDGLHDGFEIATFLCQSVLYTYRYLWVDDSLDDTFGFQFAQSITKNAIRQSLDRRGQFAKSPGTIQERIENKTGPTFPKKLNCMLVTRTNLVCLGFCLCFCW